MLRRLPLFLLVLLAPLMAVAQTQNGVKLVEATLLAEPTNGPRMPGQPVTVGLRLKMAPHWHTYWQNSGDYGLPTEIDWKLPEGWKAGPIQWPLPQRITQGDIVTFGYEDETLLLVELTPPPGAVPDLSAIVAKASWLVCKESCVPGDAEVKLANPVGPDPEVTALFAKYRAQLPQPWTKDAGFTVARGSTAKEVTLEVRGLRAGEAAKLEFFPIPPNPETALAAPVVEPKGADGALIRLAVTQPSAAAGKVTGVLVLVRDGQRVGWALADADFLTASAAPANDSGAIASSGGSPPSSILNPPSSSASPGGLGYFLLLGLLGGLLLNVMPCVLPVLGLKVMSFLAQAGESPGRVRALGLAYTGGVFTWFLGLAAVLATLRTGLSVQFQNPWFLVAICVVVFVFALSLLGVFEIVLPGNVENSLGESARSEGLGGAYFQGLLATLLGTSCTAPLLGAAAGYALAQPPAVVFAIFGAMALGMALPMLLFTLRPGWRRFLPRPGAWMERLRQGTGFALLATVLFLLWVLGRMRGADAVVWTVALLLCAGFAGWLYGIATSPLTGPGGRRTAVILAVLALLGGGWFTTREIAAAQPPNSAEAERVEGGIAWEKWSPAAVEAALAEGKPVFVDFTADWCVNCKWNEKTVLETDSVRSALRGKNFRAFKADWTRGDPVITAALKQHGRAGVPVYLVYPAGKAAPQVLPELLTQGLVLEALNTAAPVGSNPPRVASSSTP